MYLDQISRPSHFYIHTYASDTQLSTSAARIVLGLVQVISKQPEVLKEEYPGVMWESEWLKVFAFGTKDSRAPACLFYKSSQVMMRTCCACNRFWLGGASGWNVAFLYACEANRYVFALYPRYLSVKCHT